MQRRLLAVVVVLALGTVASGQKQGDAYNGLKYDKATEVRIHGTVEEVQNFDCPISRALGNHLLLKTSSGEVVVHTAPLKFVQQYGLELAKGDNLEILGSKQKDSAGRDTMLAREIVRDNAIFRFRDETGKPVW